MFPRIARESRLRALFVQPHFAAILVGVIALLLWGIHRQLPDTEEVRVSTPHAERLPWPKIQYTEYWSFDGTLNDTRHEASGKSMGGVTYVKGRCGRALRFNGSSYVMIPDRDFLSANNGSLTVAFWMNPATYSFKGENPQGYVNFLGKGHYLDVPNYEWNFRLYNHDAFDTFPRPERTSFYVFNRKGGLGAAAELNHAAPAGSWTHVTGTVNKTHVNFYVDGIRVDSNMLRDYNVVMRDGSAPLRIGTVDKNSFFRGDIDELFIFNRMLNDGDVQELYTLQLAC